MKTVRITKRFSAPETAQKHLAQVLDLVGSRSLQEPTAAMVLPVPEGGGSADLLVEWTALREGWNALLCDLAFPAVLPGAFFRGLDLWRQVGLVSTSMGVPGRLSPDRFLRVSMLAFEADGLQVPGDLILVRSGPEPTVLEWPGFWVWVSDPDPDPTA